MDAIALLDRADKGLPWAAIVEKPAAGDFGAELGRAMSEVEPDPPRDRSPAKPSREDPAKYDRPRAAADDDPAAARTTEREPEPDMVRDDQTPIDEQNAATGRDDRPREARADEKRPSEPAPAAEQPAVIPNAPAQATAAVLAQAVDGAAEVAPAAEAAATAKQADQPAAATASAAASTAASAVASAVVGQSLPVGGQRPSNAEPGGPNAVLPRPTPPVAPATAKQGAGRGPNLPATTLNKGSEGTATAASGAFPKGALAGRAAPPPFVGVLPTGVEFPGLATPAAGDGRLVLTTDGAATGPAGILEGTGDARTAALLRGARALAGSAAGQVSAQIVSAVRKGVDRISIQLQPQELGRVDVKIEIGQDGRVVAQIVAERGDTLDLLQRDARALERSLNQAGLTTDSESLTFGLRGEEQSQWAFTGERGASGNLDGPRDGAVARAEPPADDPGTHCTRDDGRLDIRV